VTASESSSSRPTRNARRKTQSTASRKGKAPSSSTTIQTERVTEYIIRRLRGEGADGVPTPSSSSVSSGTAVPITHGAYLALLPTIWALISNPASPSTGKGTHEENKGAGGGGSFVSDMLHATLDHAIKVASKSACKRATVEFVARLMLVSAMKAYFNYFTFPAWSCEFADGSYASLLPFLSKLNEVAWPPNSRFSIYCLSSLTWSLVFALNATSQRTQP